MVRKPARPEDTRGIIRLHVMSVGDESLEVGREGILHFCNVEGTVIDDIGVDKLAGAPVRVNLAGFPECPAQTALDEVHGLSPGSAIGIVGLSRSYIFVHAKLASQSVASLSFNLHRDIGSPDLIMEARFATGLVKSKGDLEPMHLYDAPERRAALIHLSLSGPRIKPAAPGAKLPRL